MKLRRKHIEMLKRFNNTLSELHYISFEETNQFIVDNLIPIIYDGNHEDAETAEDLITIITE